MLSLDYKIFTQTDSGTSAALLIKIMPLTGKGNGKVVYQRRVEKAREKKQNSPTELRKFSLGSAGQTSNRILDGQQKNLVWLYAVGLQKRRMMMNLNTVGHWCALGLFKFTEALKILARKGSLPQVVSVAPMLWQCIFGLSVAGQL